MMQFLIMVYMFMLWVVLNELAKKQDSWLEEILWCSTFQTHNTFKSAVMAKKQEDNLS